MQKTPKKDISTSSPLFTLQETFFMQRALTLAARARGRTSPNPMVGAVFVKNNVIIAEGYHRRAGGEHAEVNALKNLSKKEVRGGTLYVTLEPCRHFGKTPPCTDFLIKKEVKKIVVAMRDPNVLVAGEGIRQLQKAGIDVRVGLLQHEAREFNEVFLYSIVEKKPFVIVKSAFTLDGKIASSSGDSKWITDEPARIKVHHLRAEMDAILTSSKTVLADDSHLGVRMVTGRDPLRVILDSKLRTSLKAKVYRDRNVLVATTKFAPTKKRRLFEKAGISLLTYDSVHIPLSTLLTDLYKRGISCVMVEAGRELVTSFFVGKLVQKVYFFVAPKIMGSGKSFIGDLGFGKIHEAIQLHDVETQKIGNDILCIGRVSTNL